VFRCQLCREVVPRNTRPIRRVVETRERQYPFRPKANRFKRKRRPNDPECTKRVRYRDDPGGRGREIARELALCPACAAAADAPAEDHHPRREVRGPPLARAA
jgi:hypothetical protein